MLELSPASPAASIPIVARPAPRALLTERERVVLGLVVDGLTNPRIAERLSISPRTAQSHVQSLMRTCAVTTRTQLAVHARRRRIVPLDVEASGTLLPPRRW